jgi:predicted phosphohydrolase
MKVYALSDLHLSITNPKPMDIFGGAWDNYLAEIERSWHELISPEDIVLIAGDISWAMTFDNALPDLAYLAGYPGKKVLLRGNHDYWWKSISTMRAAFPESVYAVQNDCLRFGKLLVFGSRGWTSPDGRYASAEDEKIYKRETERMRLSVNAMNKMRLPGDSVIAMIHYPPFNTRRESSPFTELFEAAGIENVVYGHLHGKGCRADKLYIHNGVKYYLTSCDQINNTPQFITEI